MQESQLDKKLKAEIRAELLRCAIQGQFLSYADFYGRMRPGQKMGNFPWTAHFDEIAKEERSNGYPDITFLIHKSGPSPQYPSQIDFKPVAGRPDPEQLDSLQKGTAELIDLYCPGNANPY